MANDYDKIFKENIEALLLPLWERLFGFAITKIEPLKDKFQSTIEREPDFLVIAEDEHGVQFILHIEFQTEDDKAMIYRMAEYHGLLVKMYKMEVRHYVVYLGSQAPKMATELPPEQVFNGFEIKNIGSIPYRVLLQSTVPEEIILAILADFGAEQNEAVIRLITNRLREVSEDPVALQKSLKQLGIIARIRKLDELTIKITESMPITYDITTDYLYLRGQKEGLEQGIEKARMETEKARKESEAYTIKVVTKLIQKFPQFSNDEIAQLADVTVELVAKVRKSLA